LKRREAKHNFLFVLLCTEHSIDLYNDMMTHDVAQLHDDASIVDARLKSRTERTALTLLTVLESAQ